MNPQEGPIESKSGLFLPKENNEMQASVLKRVKLKVPFKKMEKLAEGEEIVLSPETEAVIRGKMEGCFMCRYIVEDHEQNGKLTGYPKEMDGKGQFPVEAKIRHIQIEKLYVPQDRRGAAPPGEEGGDE